MELESYPQAGFRSQLKQQVIGFIERSSLSGYPALFQSAFAAESEKSYQATLFSNSESDDCKLFQFETRCRQIEITCLHIARPDRTASSNPRFPIHLQTAFYEVMGGVQTKETNAVCETNRLNSPVDDLAQLLSSRNATLWVGPTLSRSQSGERDVIGGLVRFGKGQAAAVIAYGSAEASLCNLPNVRGVKVCDDGFGRPA